MKGCGKPAPLKQSLAVYWSRRINEVPEWFKVTDKALLIAEHRYHY
ncbi:type II toxin-antitoxin system YoeB family toxin [Halomonas alkaliantarctica]|uniref:Type II toxin-antitoxin system YoeB family toxin n=1 Tax=Halomonas alkaliantarctica TaxID=232346 RepID=A0ABY8LPQ8_9GAMM|nr:type II toxin-antitoxin system YoeB family toxin [Halomonas alkaliantarctica]WGI26400.1 type II toxin-antitoxin system YoeB family toxin [Halomonas alkaliantarctica]